MRYFGLQRLNFQFSIFNFQFISLPLCEIMSSRPGNARSGGN